MYRQLKCHLNLSFLSSASAAPKCPGSSLSSKHRHIHCVGEGVSRWSQKQNHSRKENSWKGGKPGPSFCSSLLPAWAWESFPPIARAHTRVHIHLRRWRCLPPASQPFRYGPDCSSWRDGLRVIGSWLVVGHVGRRGKERTLFEPRRTISMQQKCWFQSEIERDRDRVRVRSKRCHNTRYQLQRVFGTPVTTKKLLMELEIFVLSPAPLFFSPPNNERPTWPNTSMCVCV